MSKEKEDLVTIEAGAVTVTGSPEQVEDFVAAGLYARGANRRPMASDEDHAMTGVYVGVGLLLAAGAGYLAWRYLLSDDAKNRAKDLIADTSTRASRAVRDYRSRVQH